MRIEELFASRKLNEQVDAVTRWSRRDGTMTKQVIQPSDNTIKARTRFFRPDKVVNDAR